MKIFIYLQRFFLFLAIVFLTSNIFAQTTVFNEDFEGTLQVTPTGIPAWSVNSTLQVSGTNSYHNVIGLGSIAYFETSTMDLTGYSFVNLTFSHICKIELADSARIFVSVNNGATWQILPNSTYLGSGIYYINNKEGFSAASYTSTWLPANPSATPTNAWWKNEVFNVSSIVANQSQVKFRFYLKDGNNNGANMNAGWFLDDIKITASFSELIPPVVTLVAPILQDTVYSLGPFNINATITDASGISEAKLFYTINASPWDSVLMTNTSGTNYLGIIPGQPYNTQFQYYIKAKDNSPAYNVTQIPIMSFINKKPPPVFTIGTGTTTTSSTAVTPYSSNYEGVRIQYLIRASELTVLGVPAGPILAIAFDVTLSGPGTYPQLNYTMKMGHTSNTEINGDYGIINGNWTTVYTNPSEPAPPVGWKTHSFSAPFMWDGTSNILIDICHENDNNGACGICYSSNSTVRYTATTFNSVFGRYNDNAPACNINASSTISSSEYKNRPNMKITTPPSFDLDAGVVLIPEPTGQVDIASPANVKVKIKNFGNLNLTSANIEWSVNGLPQTTYPWTGNMFQDEISGEIPLGSANLTVATNIIKVWTSLPNGQTDMYHNNDTLISIVYGCDGSLNGNYTIDSTQANSGTNFKSFEDAFVTLTNCGVSGPVVFTIAPGTYNTQLIFNDVFNGSSSTNTITFKGSPGTIISHSTSVTDNRAAVLFDGTKYIRLDSVTVTIPSSSAFATGIQFINGAEDIQIRNCTVNVDVTSTTQNYNAIVASGSLITPLTTGNSAHNILIENNTIIGGYYGILFYGSSTNYLSNIVIRNNNVLNSYYYGIRAGYTNGVTIEGNDIQTRIIGGTALAYSVYIQNENGPLNVSRNLITNSGTYGIFIASAAGSASNRSLLSNNAVGGFRSSGSPYGIYLTNCSYIDVLYNSVVVEKGTGRAIWLLSSATNLRVLNNTFSFTGTAGGYAAYIQTSPTMILELDNNNYYSTGTKFVYYNSADRANLAALQAVNQPANNDLNSVSGNPLHISVTSLMPIGTLLNNIASPQPNVPNDILGVTRSMTTPDIGAYEFSSLNGDIALIEAKFKNGTCISNNDSIYYIIHNVYGDTIFFAIDPLTFNYVITGTVNSTASSIWNTGFLPPNEQMIIGIDGVDLSSAGSYYLKAYINLNSVNNLTLNDTLFMADDLTILPQVFDALPNMVNISDPAQTTALSINTNLFPPIPFKFTEICQFRTASLGNPPTGWPTYLVADDYVEITGIPNSDLGGYKLEQWDVVSLVSSYTFPSGTVLSPNGTAVIAVGELGSGIASPANFYYHGNGSFTGTFSSSIAIGRIIKDPYDNIVDAVGYNAFTFPDASGVTPQHWSGNVSSATSTAGIRLNGNDVNSPTNWIVSSAVNPQDPNSLNNNVTNPVYEPLANFAWSLNGTVTSENNTDTIVGPWSANNMYNYVASYLTPCGLFKDTVKINVNIPLVDISVTSIESPASDQCYYLSEDVTIKIKNTGLNSVAAGTYSASYSVDGGIPVTETVNIAIPSGNTIAYTFTTPLTVTFTGQYTNITIEAFVNMPSDPIPTNDSLTKIIKLRYTPAPPVISNVSIPYGTFTTLNANAVPPVYWFSNPDDAPVYTGNPYTTPILYGNANFWVSSGISLNKLYNFDIDLEGWTPSTPCTAPTTFSWNSDGGNGTAFITAPASASGAALLSPVIYLNSDTTFVSFRHKFNTQISGDEGYLAYKINNGNWTTFVPTFGAYTTQNATINQNPLSGCNMTTSQPAWSGSSDGYMNSSGIIETPGASTLQLAFVFNTDASVGSDGWNIDWISIAGNACASSLTPVSVTVTNVPAIDVGAIEITTPNSGINLGNQIVRVKVKNYGTAPIINVPISYSVNGSSPVSGIITSTILPGDTVTYQFPTPYIFGAFGPYNFKAYTTLASDLIIVNDTAQKTVNNNQLQYCPSYATDAASYGDIGNVTVSNLNNGIGTPTIYNPNATGGYNDFSLTVSPVEFAPGYSYPMSVTVISSSSYYTYYVKAFIDYNQDATFDPVTELVFQGVTQSASNTVINGTVLIPMSATSGYSRMRVVCVETSTASVVQPCGTYLWGETEDYTVLISPILQYDAGVVDIIAPDGIFSEGDVVDVTLKVKNFGTDTLTSIPLNYSYNGNPAVLQTWTGSLPPNQTVNISMPSLTVTSGVSTICGTTEVNGDSNLFNDQSCGTFWGLPVFSIFTDNFEGTSLFSTTSTVWQHGIPAAPVINSAFEGDSCWVTNLTGQYPAMATEYLVSPMLNFTGISGAVLSLAYWMHGEVNSDGGYVQYSTNNGITWATLGVINDPAGYNWYDSYVGAQPGWSLPTNGWRQAFISLAPLDNAGSAVKLRFVFRSNATIQNEGFAVDDVKIHVPLIATDAGIVEITAPIGQSVTGAPNQVTVKIKNFGSAPLTSVPVSYKLSTTSIPVNSTWTGNLNPGDETTFTFPQTFIGPFNPFSICSYTNITSDYYKFNDTTCIDLTPGLAAIDGGVTDITAPDILPPSGQSAPVTIVIKNFGMNPLTNFPVQYSVNGNVQTTEIVMSTLNPGASMNYTFITQYTSQGSDIQLCAKTAIPSDAISSNDQFCENVQVGIDETNINGVMLYQNVPNPASDASVIRFSIPTAGKLTFTLHNILGQALMNQSADYGPGLHQINLNLKDLSPGLYYYSILIDQTKLTRKMTIE